MTVNDITSMFGSIFSLLWNSKILGMPYLFWFVLIGIFGIVGSFLAGGKKSG